MQPFTTCPHSVLNGIQVVLTDIDDTVTHHGRLPSESLAAMELLSAAGIQVVPVTGRPAGWCDHIARMWPVSAVVGENGAFYFSYDRVGRKMKARYAKELSERSRDREKLNALAKRVLQAVPGAALASDQPYRVADLAIDFCEDVPPLSGREILQIQEILEAGGATTKVSSIHVNAWFGNYDKLTMTRECLKDLFNIDIKRDNKRIIFTGDSPNDCPMFNFFDNSVGMANVKNFTLPHDPAYVTELPDAKGFVSVTERIIESRTEGI